jgi:hypothetical protein
MAFTESPWLVKMHFAFQDAQVGLMRPTSPMRLMRLLSLLSSESASVHLHSAEYTRTNALFLSQPQP